MRRTLNHQLGRFLGAIARRVIVGVRSDRPPGLTVGVVDDPRLPIRLVRAAGVIDPMSINRVLSTWEHLTAPHLVHLDLHDASIVDVTTMTRLEAALDHLERRRIAVRIVGVDPHHPAIAS